MRIIVVHNRYRYAGGEDSVVRSEVEMLRSEGHTVELFEADNQSINGFVTKISAAGSLFRSSSSNRKMAELIRTFRPHLLHIHNWFPQISPSIIAVAREAGIPIVQTLHNFRMICANGVMFRDGKVCGDCLGKAFPPDATVHGCYGGSRIGSALVSAAFSYHRLAHTWDGISTFIALSEYQRRLLIQSGMEAGRITVKPNFVKDTGEVGNGRGGYALFVGRLMPEKGIRTLLNAWDLNRVSLPLWIMGNGPLADEVRERAMTRSNVEYFGHQSAPDVFSAMSNARFLICASECVEAFGLTIVESLSRGTPVLAAYSDSVAELVEEGKTGLYFASGDADDLATKAAQLASDTSTYSEMRVQCRRTFEERYTDKSNYKLLMEIYRRACRTARASVA
jgi:glycosyltransferase involved in cell wall biosynthesis